MYVTKSRPINPPIIKKNEKRYYPFKTPIFLEERTTSNARSLEKKDNTFLEVALVSYDRKIYFSDS